MLKLLCPACGAELQFKSRVSVFGVCTYCQSMVVRHDMNLETMGKMAELPGDTSVLQVGTRGKYQNSTFEIVGRLKIGWEDGQWNEWYVLFENGKEGWLAEAQGNYMMMFPEKNARNIPNRKDVWTDRKIELVTGVWYSVDDVKEATCIGSEGELPMRAPKGRRSTSVDVSAPGEKFGTLDYSEEGVAVYLGKYAEFDDLQLTGLRELDGW